MAADLAALKRAAAEVAIGMVESGMTLGLGTGSTVEPFVELLGSGIFRGRLRKIRGVPTSKRTARLARSRGVALVSLAEAGTVDLTVDGADEIAPGLDLVKGLGGALLREKMVAQASKRFVIVADSSKLVGALGERSPLAVETLRWEHASHLDFFVELGARPVLRRVDDGSPSFTDNGNFVYDLYWESRMPEPELVDRRLRSRGGVVETGLFLGMADAAVVAGPEGIEVTARTETGAAADRTGR